jgi:uncharacterized membrane protein (DUF485 family)
MNVEQLKNRLTANRYTVLVELVSLFVAVVLGIEMALPLNWVQALSQQGAVAAAVMAGINVFVWTSIISGTWIGYLRWTSHD